MKEDFQTYLISIKTAGNNPWDVIFVFSRSLGLQINAFHLIIMLTMFSLINNSECDIMSFYQKSGGVLQLGSGTNQISRKISVSEVLFKFKTFQVKRNTL